ncbi:MAG: magnesium/cobalt transporter CorA [Gammaproteobacteria bacterium]|jgi:magnesium transporter
MSESLSSASAKAGFPPGSLVHVGEAGSAEARISVVDYTKKTVEEEVIQSIDQIAKYKGTESVTWVNVEGLKNIRIVEDVGLQFNIHPLVLEDILNTHQRPKVEEYDDFLYIVLKGLLVKGPEFLVIYEQISIILTDKFVLTFKEKQDDIFAPLKRRIYNNKGPIRNSGADYLAYAILDTIVDRYFTLQDSLDDMIDTVEDKLLADPDTPTLITIQRLKRELVYIRKSVSPVRELLSTIQRSDSPLIQERTQIYFRDVFDHVLRVSEAIESNREMLSGLLDIYISSVSNKMNEVMKVLTVFASIFIPLTFIAGIYGMNFEYMPELHWKWAYPILWVAFVGIAGGLLVYFRKKKWL